MDELKQRIAELTGRVSGLEAEISVLRAENEALKQQIEYAILLAKTGSPVIPDGERINACNVISNSIKQTYDTEEISKQFK